MSAIQIPTANAVVEINKFICTEGGHPHHCYGVGKIESAISTAFYPGVHPFHLGGIAKVAGALCFYLVKSHAFMDGNKRTGALTSIAFLNLHGLDLKYPIHLQKNVNALAGMIEQCAAGNTNRDELILWFDGHKIKLK